MIRNYANKLSVSPELTGTVKSVNQLPSTIVVAAPSVPIGMDSSVLVFLTLALKAPNGLDPFAKLLIKNASQECTGQAAHVLLSLPNALLKWYGTNNKTGAWPKIMYVQVELTSMGSHACRTVPAKMDKFGATS